MSTTATATDPKEQFLAGYNRLERELTRPGRPALARLRKSAIARFGEIGFPTARTEDWRFTSVAPLVRHTFEAAQPGPHGRSAADLVDLPGADAGCRLVFVNGFFAPELSAVPNLPGGAVVGSLARALAEGHAEAEAHLGRHARFDDNAFTALNTALFPDGAFVRVPRGKVIEEPVYLLFVTAPGATPLACYPRNLVVAGPGSQVSLVEVYGSLGEGTSFTSAVTEIVAADGAVLDHTKVQQEGPGAFHFANTQLHQDHASNVTSLFVGLGAQWSRNEVRVLLDAEGCECTLNGLYQAAGRQHMDNHTVIDHGKPHCASHELYKGILDAQAHGVFNGKIFVRPDAQKTDAKQTNQTLLLSEDATINTKPQLEIYADDVKCTHGATVGQLDAEALFYLRSRGVGRDDARALLTYAFANDVLGRIKVEGLRARLERTLLGRTPLAGLDAEERT
jgi:Fe-S cluster assembly protein SufD